MERDETNFDPCVLDDEDEILLASLLEGTSDDRTSDGSTDETILDNATKASANTQKPHDAKNDSSTKTSNQVGTGMLSRQIEETNGGFSGQLQSLDNSCYGLHSTEDTDPFTKTEICSTMPPSDIDVFSQDLQSRSLSGDEHPNLPNLTVKAWDFVEQVCQLCRRLESNSPGVMGQISPIDVDELAFACEHFLRALELFRQQGKPTQVELGYLYTTSDQVNRINANGLVTRHRPEPPHKICCDGISVAKNPFACHGKQGNVGLVVGCLPGFSVTPSYCGNTIADSIRTNRGQRNELNILKTSGQCLPMIRFTAHLVKPHRKEHHGNMILFHLHQDLQTLLEKFIFQALNTYPQVSNRQTGIPTSPRPCTTEPSVEPTHSRMRSQTITPPSREKPVQQVVSYKSCRPLTLPNALATSLHHRRAQFTNTNPHVNKPKVQEAELVATFQGKRAPELHSSDSNRTKKPRIQGEDSPRREETKSPKSSSCIESAEQTMSGEDGNGVFQYVREGKFSILTQQCAICMDILMQKANGKLVQLNRCQHYFHENCLKTSMQQSHVCPSCQLPFSND